MPRYRVKEQMMTPKPNIQSKKHVARLERERRQTRMIQYIAIGVVLAVVLIVGYGFLNLNYLQPRQPVAEVNGEKIQSKEFQARVVLQRRQLLEQYANYYQYQQFGIDVSQQLQQIESYLGVPSLIGQQVLDVMIAEALIRQEAEKRDITVSDDELETYTQEQFGFFPNGTLTPTVTPTLGALPAYPTLSAEQLKQVTATPLPSQTPNPSPTATFDLSVTPVASSTPTGSPPADPTVEPPPTLIPTATATPYTMEGYQTRVADTISSFDELGLNETQYRQLLKTSLLRQKLFDAVTSDVPREDEQVWARHILVADEETANQVLARLKSGEEFGAIAAELSEDLSNKDQGGDLGWFGKGRMVAEFEEAAFALGIGEISDPVQSQFGFHIIQLLNRTTLPLDDSGWQQARERMFEDFLSKLREDADVIIHDIWTERVPTTPSLNDLLQQQPLQ